MRQTPRFPCHPLPLPLTNPFMFNPSLVGDSHGSGVPGDPAAPDSARWLSSRRRPVMYAP